MIGHSKSSILILVVFLFLLACNNQDNNSQSGILAHDKNSINKNLSEAIKTMLKDNTTDSSLMIAGVTLPYNSAINFYYQKNNFLPIWSDTGVYKKYATELVNYLDTAIRDGLNVNDYNFRAIQQSFQNIQADSTGKFTFKEKANLELLMTDAFMHVITDIRQGRLISDSANWKNNPQKYQDFYAFHLNQVLKTNNLSVVLNALHPQNKEYQSLRMAIRSFTDSMDTREHTYLVYPFKSGDSTDSVKFISSFQKRLSEDGFITYDKNKLPDSLSLSVAIKNYQKKKSLKTDGKITKALIKNMNLTDEVRLKRIFVTLDRYKILKDTFPARYIWVNLPAYTLKVFDHDTIAMTSKIICGKPNTQTPLLTSDVDELVTYPTWTVPSSIISKELLPGLKKNSAYLSKKGLGLFDKEGNKVNPSTVDWSNYTKGIPFKVRQSSGDNNALGVMKFNFDNPHAVYLHDTNQRGLFGNSYRALSHGCVRVQEWKSLAYYIARVDSMNLKTGDTLRYTTDSIGNWLDAKKRKTITVKNKLKLYIQYFTCEGIEGRIVFHDDIYEEDKKMIEKYWNTKK